MSGQGIMQLFSNLNPLRFSMPPFFFFLIIDMFFISGCNFKPHYRGKGINHSFF